MISSKKMHEDARRCMECPETVIKGVQDARRVFPNRVGTLRNVTEESRRRKKNEPILCFL